MLDTLLDSFVFTAFDGPVWVALLKQAQAWLFLLAVAVSLAFFASRTAASAQATGAAA